MTVGAINIGWLELSLATLFIMAAGAASIAMSLGLLQTLAIATLRTYLQLMALGFVLTWIFEIDSVWIVLGVFLLMMLMTAQILLQRVKHKPPNLYLSTLMAVVLSGIVVTFSVTGAIVQVEPWYDPRYVLTIGGMVLGNSMNGIALTLERFFDDLKKRTAEVNQALAFGATPWEASRPSIRTALNAGLTPTINSMSAVGLVAIPGMMTGQLLAGADPVEAAKYQIVVMLMISAATALGAMCSVYLVYKRAFDQEWRFYF
ncbi:MAG: iron export ABC transporter permease subunit FetB [Candidatus Parabeggiatoa sp. nov. 3]|nr:MAG: iron export ABC transporter permease subunit FetB [Gammaproteobacteria bacterium]RKZ68587.1 MAG: iron export ABC transporter permease subunit FetB [Gammaproteobacteria bacterium]RKZ88324.1 MAG: iron export ABC transporter permease subunit FetB [Gammaproteobacteria bacterium]